jgi:hypothetical protein
MVILIQLTTPSYAYDFAWQIVVLHNAIRDKSHNPCNNSCPNKRANSPPCMYTRMLLDKISITRINPWLSQCVNNNCPPHSWFLINQFFQPYQISGLSQSQTTLPSWSDPHIPYLYCGELRQDSNGKKSWSCPSCMQ